MVKPIILAGGKGSRLWPLSTAALPKQFLSLSSSKNSLLQETVLRVSELKAAERPLIMCNQKHLSLCKKQMSKISKLDLEYIAEPFGRNTGPAVLMAALYCLEYLKNDPILLILPADHWIAEDRVFCNLVEEAAVMAAEDVIITFGVTPTVAHTGYGYIKTQTQVIKQNIKKIISFKEKPDQETAEKFMAEGNYYWNSGIFIAKASVLINESKKHASILYQDVNKAFSNSQIVSGDFLIHPESFSRCPDLSLDYALMEKTDSAIMLPFQSEWSDLGCWSAVAQLNERGISENYLKGNIITHRTKNCYIQTDVKTIATLGIENMVIINSENGILVGSKDHLGSMKEVVKELEIFHTKNERPWGHYECMVQGEGYQVKRLTIKPGERLSLQLHHHRAETWVIVSGKAEITLGDEIAEVMMNQSVFIPVGIPHRVKNVGDSALIIIETQVGEYLGEDDIVRLEDDYGRL